MFNTDVIPFNCIEIRVDQTDYVLYPASFNMFCPKTMSVLVDFFVESTYITKLKNVFSGVTLKAVFIYSCSIRLWNVIILHTQNNVWNYVFSYSEFNVFEIC